MAIHKIIKFVPVYSV